MQNKTNFFNYFIYHTNFAFEIFLILKKYNLNLNLCLVINKVNL